MESDLSGLSNIHKITQYVSPENKIRASKWSTITNESELQKKKNIYIYPDGIRSRVSPHMRLLVKGEQNLEMNYCRCSQPQNFLQNSPFENTGQSSDRVGDLGGWGFVHEDIQLLFWKLGCC